MKKIISLLLAVLTLLASGTELAQARKLPRTSSLKKVRTRQPYQSARIAPGHLSLRIKNSLPRHIRRWAKETRLMPALNAPIRRAVLPLQEAVQNMYDEKPFTASSFVIEEEFEGKKYLWGVTAAHIAVMMNAYPALLWGKDPAFIEIEFTANGASSMADVALFPLDDMAGMVTPLKLAKKPPLPGEKTYSFGFFNDNFYLVPDRVVEEITPNRIVTSLEFQTENRSGACGGPVLNERGEVVGIHVGSSGSHQVSFVVPTSEIKRLLYAYRHGGKALKPLVFNGEEIGQININEQIEKAYTVTNGRKNEIFAAWHHKEVDVNHLETLTNNHNPDELVLFIRHRPFSAASKTDESYIIRLTYDFRNKKASTEKLKSLPVD